jgi:hypothetical protein
LANQKSQPVSVYGEESKESTLSTGTTTGSHISTATTEVDPKILDENSNEFQTKTFESNSVPSKYKL